MEWIQIIEEAGADAELKKAYDQVKGDRGKVANILKIHSLLPKTMTGHLDFYMNIMFAPGSLSRRQRELIATVVSSVNRCDYCVNHHAEALRAYEKDHDIVNQIMKDYTQVDLDTKDRAMCDYAVKLTQTPNQMRESDVELLRESGLDDRSILLVTLIIGYFNFVNRVALGLGVPLSEEEMKGYKY